MKNLIILPIAAAAVLGLASCQKKEMTLRGEVSDKVGDALDTRDHEKLRDASEELEKDVKKAGEGIGDAIKEVGEEIKKDVHNATE